MMLVEVSKVDKVRLDSFRSGLPLVQLIIFNFAILIEAGLYFYESWCVRRVQY